MTSDSPLIRVQENWGRLRQIHPRNYYNLLQFLTDIHEYQLDDARTFVKAFRTLAADWRNSEATFAEVIVYRYYVRLVYENIICAVRHGRKECDIIVDRLDGSTAFLEVFSIMPNMSEVGGNVIQTHTQDAMASVRQKLLRKIRKQNQMTKARDNYAVIELNDVSIAGSFTVLSSLSSGYKVTIDHTTLSRRGQHLHLTLRRVPRRAALHLFIDSTGLSMVGEGEWAAAKHGRRGRRGWKKLHLGVDQAGAIVAQALTDAAVDDASTGIDLIETIASSARTVTADAAYDTLAVYETANTRGTTVVVPPAKTAKLSRRNPRSSARDGTIRRISKIGRRRWKKEVGYHRQARVENAFFRYKSILGDRLRSRTRAAQAVESVLACNVLNRMTELGRPESFAIDR